MHEDLSAMYAHNFYHLYAFIPAFKHVVIHECTHIACICGLRDMYNNVWVYECLYTVVHVYYILYASSLNLINCFRV